MSPEERVNILRECEPDSWLVFNADESQVVAKGKSYGEVVAAAYGVGETDIVIVKIPPNWNPRA
jgi:hypothetical protein